MKKYYLSVLLVLTLLFGCAPNVPENWQSLGVPSKGIVKVYDHSDSNGFYADYTGYTSEGLLKQIINRLSELGFSEVCSEFEGKVKGFQNKDQKYIVKVDDLGGKIGLSIFNENGAEPLLFGLCFKGYKIGEPTRNK